MTHPMNIPGPCDCPSCEADTSEVASYCDGSPTCKERELITHRYQGELGKWEIEHYCSEHSGADLVLAVMEGDYTVRRQGNEIILMRNEAVI